YKATVCYLRQHGNHIRKLRCEIVDKAILELIAETCQGLNAIYLRFNLSSYYVTYGIFERFLARLNNNRYIASRKPQLDTVNIAFDLSYFHPSFFWSLFQLSSLEHLTMRTFTSWAYIEQCYSKDVPEIYKEYLEGCPSLKTFEFTYTYEYGKPGPQRPIVQAVHRWLREKRMSPEDQAPSSFQEAMARRILASGEGTTMDKQATEGRSTELTAPKQPVMYSLQRLRYKTPELTPPTLHFILQHSPVLQELELGGVWGDFDPASWMVLAKHAPQLRALTLMFEGKVDDFPTFPQLISYFPRLESLYFFHLLFKDEPHLSTMISGLQEHEKIYGSPHPLRTLRIAGTTHDALKTLLDMLAYGPSRLETFAITKRWQALERGQWNPPASPVDLDLLAAPWPCLDTLTNLDMSFARFPDKSSLHHFFNRLQECDKLQVLRMQIRDLRDLISNAKILPFALSPGGSLRSGYSSRSSSFRYQMREEHRQQRVEDLKQFLPKEDELAGPPALNYFFPSLRALELTCTMERTHPGLEQTIQIYEIQLLVDKMVMPSLRCIRLRGLSTVNNMSWPMQQFPKVTFSDDVSANVRSIDAFTPPYL
ncbi:hypothetical protein BGZ95_007186, partial [Linnemannia exigua]